MKRLYIYIYIYDVITNINDKLIKKIFDNTNIDLSKKDIVINACNDFIKQLLLFDSTEKDFVTNFINIFITQLKKVYV